VLDERAVVGLVSKDNPALKAALLDAESARFGEVGLTNLYTPVVVLDASGTQTETPSLFATGISMSRQRRGDVGAELRKHMLWGTDISLRVAGSVLWTKFTRPSLTLPTIPGMIATPTVGSTGVGQLVSPTGEFGPGYGLLGKLTLKQPLLRGRGPDVALADLNVSRAERTASQHTRDRVASEQLRDALNAYWELWYAVRMLDIQQRAREVAGKQRDDARARVDTGGLAPVEVFAFETQVASRDEDVAAAEAEHRRAQLELDRLLGVVGAVSGVGVADAEPPTMLIAPRSTLEERAMAESAELHERQAAVELARVRQRTATEPQRHRLDLDAYAQVQGLGNEQAKGALKQVGQFEAVSAFVGLTYEAPINSRALHAAAARARIDIEAAEQELVVTRQRILTDLSKGLEQELASERRVELASQTVAIAEKQLAAEQARFATGAATSLQVLEAEDSVRSARLRMARAQADLVQAAVSLDHLTGQLVARFSR